MSPDEVHFPVAYYNGTAFFFAPTDRHSPTYFGGPSDITFTGVRHGPEPLHHILTLAGAVIPALVDYHVFSLPLFYGLRYDACSLTYRMPERSVCEITKLQPRRSSADWPYRDYPRLLPYIPLRLSRRTRCTAKRFAKLSYQGLEIKPTTMVVVVPPVFIGGVSMWGPMGDAEGVQIVFECDFENKTVRASNQCT